MKQLKNRLYVKIQHNKFIIIEDKNNKKTIRVNNNSANAYNNKHNQDNNIGNNK